MLKLGNLTPQVTHNTTIQTKTWKDAITKFEKTIKLATSIEGLRQAGYVLFEGLFSEDEITTQTYSGMEKLGDKYCKQVVGRFQGIRLTPFFVSL